MFSATMPDKIQQMAAQLLNNPVMVKIAVSKPAEKIKQSAFVCYDQQKLAIIRHLFKTGNLNRVIIFSGKKDKVKEIGRELKRINIKCGMMHSDLSQAERDEEMFKFKSGQTNILVATDIVARGIDIDDIQLVINYDVPHDVEDYVHRIGRTARADRDGAAITFVNERDIPLFNQIEKFLGKVIEKQPLPEGIGEGPEYKLIEKRRSKGVGRKKSNRPHAKRHNNRGRHKPKKE